MTEKPAQALRMSTMNKPKKVRNSSGPPLYVDTITESVISNGTLLLSFGAVFQDMGVDPEIEISCRLRLNLATAQQLHELLGHCISGMERRSQAPTTQKPPETTPPKSQTN